MNIRLYVFFISVFISQICFGQPGTDSIYIEKYSQKMTIKTFISRNSIQIEHNEKDYFPNNPTRIGLGFSIKNTVVNLSYSFGILPVEKNYGKTKSIDFQIHNYGRKFLIDLFYQKYQGFYNDKGSVCLYPETSVEMIGGELSYVFNHKRFSTKATFEQTEKQLLSAGSFLIGGGAYRYKLRLEEVLGSDRNRINHFQLGINAGYGYSWVINKRWLISGMATLGLNAGNEINMLEAGKLKLYPTVFSRGAAGYSKNDWGISLSFLVNNKLVYYDRDYFSLTSANMQITYTKHLDHFFGRIRRF